MTDEDIFFTHTVVGQAMSIEMGSSMNRKSANAQIQLTGSQAGFVGGLFLLPQIWKDWCLIQGAYPYAGLPRRRPGRVRRWLERYALIWAVAGLLMLLCNICLLSAVVLFTDFPVLEALSQIQPTKP